MGVNDKLNRILNDYSVSRDFQREVKEGYRNPLEFDIVECLNEQPQFRYGGSLAKGTANSNSCDIDLLCYMNSDSSYTVGQLYEKIEECLSENRYIYEAKNSAICVKGKIGEGFWDTSVDVVPGKYTSNDENKDVRLWCNKTKNNLLSNPVKQIEKVKKSKVRDLIRIIKLYREFNSFQFKSFFLEIFAIDIVAKDLPEDFTLYEALVLFCSKYKDIGVVRISDPANENNNIMNIHSESEFKIIRNKIKTLYEVLLTNNEENIIKCIKGDKFDIDLAYELDAKKHSQFLNLGVANSFLNLICITEDGSYIYSKEIVGKGKCLKFIVNIPEFVRVKKVDLIISNSGYESILDPRGDGVEMIKTKQEYTKVENTKYNGNHYVQVMVTDTNNKHYYSKVFIVKVRDF